MDKQIVHFMKWTTQLSISRNGQNIYPFREMDKKSTVHFMKWTTKCMKFLLSSTVKKPFFFAFLLKHSIGIHQWIKGCTFT